jgi:hypothetical protein
MSDADPNPITSPSDGSAPLTSAPQSIRFSLGNAFLLTAVVAVILGFGRIVVLRARAEAARLEEEHLLARLKSIIPHSFTEIATGVQLYGGVHKLDPGGRKDRPWPPPTPMSDTDRPLHSWRLQIAPIFPISLYPMPEVDLRLAWDAPINLAFAQELGAFFTFDSKWVDTKAHVFAITGPDSAFDGAAVSRYADLPENIVVAMEIRDSHTECFEPGDYNVTDLLAYRGKIGDHLHGLLEGRLHVLFADGEVWALDPNAPIADLQPFLTITGAKSHDRDQLLGPHRVD